MLALQIPAN